VLALAACGRSGTPASDAESSLGDAAPNAAVDTRDAAVPEASVDIRELGAPDATGTPDQPSAPDVAVDNAPTVPQDARSLSDAAEIAPRCPGTCNAATPSLPTVGPDGGQGNITMYTTEASNGGACNYGATGVLYFAAVNVNVAPGDGHGQWQGGHICGQCVEVTALTTQGPQSVVVRIMDKCPDTYCGIDLGGAAPAAVMREDFGRYDGSWRFVSCAGHPEVSDGPTSLFVLSGANGYWSRVQVRNPPAAVQSIAWRDSQGASGTFPYATDPEDTFEVPAAVLQSIAATITLSALFSDGTTEAVEVSPARLATGNASYAMK
jgi:hypothetical protein